MPKLAERKTLSANVIKALEPRDNDYYERDAGQAGLGVRVYTTGVKTYCFYSKIDRQWHKIADCNAIDVNQAREIARHYSAKIVLGENPFAKKEELAKTKKVTALCQEYWEYRQSSKAKEKKLAVSTLEARKYYIGVIARKTLGKMDINAVKTTHAMDFLDEFAERPSYGNRIRNFLGLAFRYALQRGYLQGNANIWDNTSPYQEQRQRKRLNREEIVRVLKHINTLDTHYRAPLLLMYLSGARPNEICSLKWEEIDWEQKTFCKVRKNDRDAQKPLPLGDVGIAILSSIKEEQRGSNSPYVFARVGRSEVVTYKALYYRWEILRTECDVDAGMYALRRNFAAVGGVVYGGDITHAQNAMGHSTAGQTMQYAMGDEEIKRIEVVRRVEDASKIQAALQQVLKECV